MGAYAHFFPTGDGLHHIWKVGHTPHLRNETESGSLALRLMRSARRHPYRHNAYGCFDAEITLIRRPIAFMANEHLPWQLPFKLQGLSGLS